MSSRSQIPSAYSLACRSPHVSMPYWMMPARSDSASGVKVTLRLDEGTDWLSESGVLDCLALDLFEALAREFDQFAPALLFLSDRQLGAKSRQFPITLGEELNGFVD